MFAWFSTTSPSIRTKLFGFAGICVLALVAVIGLAVHLTRQGRDIAARECGTLSSQDMAHTLDGTYNLCLPQQECLEQMTTAALKVTDHMVEDVGGVRPAPDETVEWTAVNQLSGQSAKVVIPKMMFGDRWVGQNRDLNVPNRLVDDVRAQTGFHCTLFQRMNATGDMLRVSTTHPTANGVRASGTFIPQTNPDGNPNPVVASLLSGKTYRGRARVLNAWYITAYKPLVNAEGAVIGAVYVGIPQENVPGLRAAIRKVEVGASGRAFVLDTPGTWIISSTPSDEGRNVFAAGASDKDTALREVCERARALKSGETAEKVCEWTEGGTKRTQVVRFAYFAPWDWVIGVYMPQDEIRAGERRMSEMGDRTQTQLALVGGLAALVTLCCAAWLARSLTRPIGRTMSVLEAVAHGDLTRTAEVTTRDEVGRMAVALNTAIVALRDAEVQKREAAEREARETAAREREKAEQQRRELEKEHAEAAERDRVAAELRAKVDQMLVGVNALAAGDFTQQVPDLGTDAVGQMARSLNKAILSVRTALEGVREVSVQLADASGQLSSATEEISMGAQDQASSLEETASSLEEITATVKQNSDSAQQARQLASSSKEVAEKGGQVVGNAVGAMSAINESSKKIADIITTIDEIAFQTNLLALNAAVEAARAGEQGRGFAVVASEVRNLAQRSATAAKEIKGLIEDSVKKVDAGTELVNRSGSTLGDIVTSVARVTAIITEIAGASKEQSVGIDQVNKAVSQMDTVTQRNAAQTEELSATAQTLTDQAGQLRDLVARFKLNEEHMVPKSTRSRGSAPKPRPVSARAAVGSSDDGFAEF